MKQQVLSGIRLGILGLLPVLLLGACARVNDTSLRLVSSKVGAYLRVNGQLLEGDVLLVPDRTGRVSFSAAKGAIRQCSGAMRYTATSSTEIDLHCNEGTQLVLNATLLSETRGYGYGSTPQGPASVAFGLSEEDAAAFMGRAAPESPAQTP
jgi:hypothetical protein